MSFEFTTEVDVRYADVDTYGHVNNATYGTYFEEARVDYFREVVGSDDILAAGEDGIGIVLATLKIEYESPVEMTDSVSVGVRVPRLGETSFPFEYELRDDGTVAATGETTVVVYDRGSESPRPIPDRWRENIAQFEGLEPDRR